MNIQFFKSASAFRRWLGANHARVTELWVGFFKKDSGKSGITYAEAVDEALCFGWIDGLKKRVDEFSYTQRFTPRKHRSIWSRVNIQHVARLKKAGRVTPAGLQAFEARDPKKSGVYSFENAARNLTAADESDSGRTQPRGFFPAATARLSANRHLVGGQCEEKGDAIAATGTFVAPNINRG